MSRDEWVVALILAATVVAAVVAAQLFLIHH